MNLFPSHLLLKAPSLSIGNSQLILRGSQLLAQYRYLPAEAVLASTGLHCRLSANQRRMLRSRSPDQPMGDEGLGRDVQNHSLGLFDDLMSGYSLEEVKIPYRFTPVLPAKHTRLP